MICSLIIDAQFPWLIYLVIPYYIILCSLHMVLIHVLADNGNQRELQKKTCLSVHKSCLSVHKFLHSEKRVPKQYRQGHYLTVRNMAPSGILFWCPSDQRVLYLMIIKEKECPRGTKTVPFFRGVLFSTFFQKGSKIVPFFQRGTVSKQKKG